MKKLFLILVLIVAIALPSVTFAHPGRTDSNGGHYCRTNCEKWGYKYGEYHYHNKVVKQAKKSAKKAKK